MIALVTAYVLGTMFYGTFYKASADCPLVLPQLLEDDDALGLAFETADYFGQSLRIMQYNVEWLFVDSNDDQSNTNCPGTGCPWTNQTDAYKHLTYVAQVISEIKPDIVNLCEVEGCDELNMLIYELDERGAYGYNGFLKQGTDTSTGQNVALLTRIFPTTNLFRTETRKTWPIELSNCGYVGTGGDIGVSKHYFTEYAFQHTNILLIGTHFLAVPTDPERCAKREAQAQIIQEVIATYVGEVILLGDFNDFDGLVLDWNDNKPTSRVLDILKGLYGEYSGNYELTSVATLIPQEQRFTDWWDADDNCDTYAKSEFSMIDHILVSPGLYRSITNAFIYHGYDEYCGKYNSDHYPIVIDLIV